MICNCVVSLSLYHEHCNGSKCTASHSPKLKPRHKPSPVFFFKTEQYRKGNATLNFSEYSILSWRRPLSPSLSLPPRLFLSANQVSHGVSAARMCSHKSCSHTTCNLTVQERKGLAEMCRLKWELEGGKKYIYIYTRRSTARHLRGRPRHNTLEEKKKR